ncbi:M64 family metallopeptidase [Streptomyces sp. NPDC053560]|uniref:M64 family metallopeptidase n=1 Tax=Streptomyces sp. NPDC053560 TaxID=3365711 RepID=UPI0037D24F61
MTARAERRRRTGIGLFAAAGLLCGASVLGTAPPAGAAAQQQDAITGSSGAKVLPIQSTGPAEKRFNLVFLGDGYTSDEMPEFRANVEKHLNVLWSTEPFASYRSYINVWAVETPSAESGVDCDPGLGAPRRDTALDMGFWGGCDARSVQRLITMDDGKARAAADLVAGTSAGNRQIVGLAHSDTYGGAGGTYATASGGNSLSSLITPHEIGHSLGKLQDEYDYYQRGVPGGRYADGEPDSAHHTVLTARQMREQRKKWWRWLGEESESGGRIGRYEGGMYSTKGVWRPSAHSMMKTLGYPFDQVEREVMTRAVAAKVNLVQGHTPNGAPIGADRSVWVDTLHPTGGELKVTWRLDGRPLPGTAGLRTVDLRRYVPSGERPRRLTATVTDPTPFVRDPAVRGSAALTRTVTWTVDPSVTTDPAPVAAEFTGHTATDAPVGASSVLYADTTHPVRGAVRISWAVDGRPVANRGNDRDLDLSALRLRPGDHTVTARVAGARPSPATRLRWTVDATPATVSYALSEPLRTVHRPGRPVEYVYDGPFTMKLTGKDDRDGYVVTQFRGDGDGWFTYFGWPTDADAPFRFSPGGTVIDDLVHGKLGTPRAVPWDDATPDYGTHTIEYRALDAAGNTGPAKRFRVTLRPPQ